MKSVAVHEKDMLAYKTCSLQTMAFCFGNGQNEGHTKEITETGQTDVLEGISHHRIHLIAVNTRRLNCMGAKDTASSCPENKDSDMVIGLHWDDTAVRCLRHRAYPTDRNHSCFIIASQQQLQNIQDWINYDFFKSHS